MAEPVSTPPSAETAPATSPDALPARRGMLWLVVGALGVVFGDIGTSPLYAFRECFSGPHGLAPQPANILGALSLIVWSLILVVSVKYVTFLLRADNRGEGGILALMALVSRHFRQQSRGLAFPLAAGLFGAALLYGDGIITPAISVLSAVEGLNVATTFFEPYIVGISLAVLTALFVIQRGGTGRIGAVFGPVLVLWFAAIGLLGLVSVWHTPAVLAALNPWHAADLFLRNRAHGFAILGTVFLAITGAEVLYADLGHFGKTPIRRGWFALVLPALLLNYAGQAAFLLREPALPENLFFRLAPPALLYPLVALATLATVIASQAVISGAFSLIRQAIQLGCWPRVRIVHTSSHMIGQVYVPGMNWALFAGTAVLILTFRTSGNLAGAYGVAVAGTMLLTTLLSATAASGIWPARRWVLRAAIGAFLVIDIAFFSSCLLKIGYGGWVPLVIAVFFYMLMTVWRSGRRALGERIEAESLPEDAFLADVARRAPHRIKGVAVFLTGNETGIPRTLLHNFKHNQVLHEHTILATIRTEEIPRVPESERIAVRALGHGFYRAIIRYGFSEEPHIPNALQQAQIEGLTIKPQQTTFFLGGETLVAGRNPVLPAWRRHIYAYLSRNAFDATQYYRIPPNRVMVVGIQIEL